jgi:hypothetical protein
VRIYGPSAPRNIPQDRNPVSLHIATNGYLAAVAGSDTTIASYTVPASRRAQILGGGVFGSVTTVLAAAQRARVRIATIPSASANRDLVRKQTAAAAAVDTFIDAYIAGLFLNPGDLVQVMVGLDAGTGAFQAAGGVFGVEYDS